MKRERFKGFVCVDWKIIKVVLKVTGCESVGCMRLVKMENSGKSW
jgi:hypothetical protein